MIILPWWLDDSANILKDGEWFLSISKDIKRNQ